MIVIRFAEREHKQQGLGYLAGRFSFRTFASGEVFVPETALAYLAMEGIPFTVEGPATYERTIAALRSVPAAAVQ